MPRTARASVGGVFYHALNRSNRLETVFHKPADYDAFVAAFADAIRRRPLDLVGYSLMPNHLHLVPRPVADGDLGRWMRWLLTAHAQRYHRHDKTSGHVWQGRFNAFPVQDDDHLATVLRYVERNALRADLVSRAEHWRWSSLPGWLAGAPPSSFSPPSQEAIIPSVPFFPCRLEGTGSRNMRRKVTILIFCCIITMVILSAESFFVSRPGLPIASPATLESEKTPPRPSPSVTQSRDKTDRLTLAAQSIEPAVMCVGHPGGDAGSAFVISREHRLLVTNAHVVERFPEENLMVGFFSGSFGLYRIKKVWIHPMYELAKKKDVVLFIEGSRILHRTPLGPDVAIIQLSDEGPDLPAECKLAPPDRSVEISVSVGGFGFSGPRPPAGTPIRAVLKTGIINFFMKIAVASDLNRCWRLVDCSVPAGEGDSGGPIFLATGEVIGINCWIFPEERRKKKSESVFMSIDIIYYIIKYYKIALGGKGPGSR